MIAKSQTTNPNFNRKTESSGRRTYEIGGVHYPSVTTVLGVLAKPALVHWAAKQERELVLQVAADLFSELSPDIVKTMSRLGFTNSLQRRLGEERAHAKQSKEATDIGGQVHNLIEWNLRHELKLPEKDSQPMLSTPEAKEGYAKYERWREARQFKPILVEQMVYSKIHGYAGTVDWLAIVDGILTLGDWKTSSGIYIEALLQASAYVNALVEMGHAEEGLRGCVVRLPKKKEDVEPETILIDWERCQRLFQIFLAALQVYNGLQVEKVKPPKPKVVFDEEAFNDFWACYPRQVDKRGATVAWKKLNPTPVQCKIMHQALANHVSVVARDGSSMPKLREWIERESWNQWLGPSREQ